MPSPRSARLLRTVCCTLLLSLTALAAPAQAPTYDVHPDLLVKHWTVEDGLPVNQINDLVQTRDGYLWMTTFDGLVRFDGDRFTVFNTSNSPGLPSNRLYWLHEDSAGALWIRTESSEIARFYEGVFTSFTRENGLPGTAFYFYQDGDTLWISTNGGLARYVDGVIKPFRTDLSSWTVSTMLFDRTGALWTPYADGLMHFQQDRLIRRYTTDDGLPDARINDLFEDRDGTIWTATTAGMARLQGNRFEPLKPEGQPWTADVLTIDQDAAGALWFGTMEGWWAYRDGRLDRFPAVEQGLAGVMLPEEPQGSTWRTQESWLYRDETPVLRLSTIASFADKRAMLVDREGNLWHGSVGLHRIRSRLLRTISKAEGLPGSNVYPILERRDGSVWLGIWAKESLVRIQDETFATFDVPRDIRPDDQNRQHLVTSLYEDRDGTLWVGTMGQLCRVEGARCVPVDLPVP